MLPNSKDIDLIYRFAFVGIAVSALTLLGGAAGLIYLVWTLVS